MFAHLHVHSTASDGLATPTELVTHAASLGFSCLALTDHNTFAGHTELLAAAARTPITVIPGIEAKVYLGARHGHAVILPQNPDEYTRLRTLVRTKPRLHIGDLIGVGYVTSGCLGGLAAQHLKHRWDYSAARDVLLRCQDLLGPRFRVEVQPTFGTLAPWLLSLAREVGCTAIVTNDVHYLHRQDGLRHNHLGLHLASAEEIDQASHFWPGYHTAMVETGLLADLCTKGWSNGRNLHDLAAG